MQQQYRFFRTIGCLFIATICSANVMSQDIKTLKDSLKLATEMLSYKPDSVDLRLKKARWNMLLEQWDYAKQEYDLVLKYCPDNIASLYYRGYANQKLGRYHFARLDYEQLLKAVPGNFSGLLALSLLNHKTKRYTDAMTQANRLISLYPDSAVAYAARAGIEKDMSMFELAELDYSEAIKREANNVDFLLNRADVRIILKKNNEALADIHHLIALGQSYPTLMQWYKKRVKEIK